MEKPNRIRQVYGYMVCLIAVVTALICINGVVGNAINLSDPLAASGAFDESLTSFDAHLASRQRFGGPADDAATRDTASVATLQRRFEALQAGRIAQQNFRARKALVTQGVVLLIACALFVTHWRWVRRLGDEGGHDAA